MWFESTSYEQCAVRQMWLTTKPEKFPSWSVASPVYHMVVYQENWPSTETTEMLMYYTVSLYQGHLFAHVSFLSLVVFLAQLISNDTSANPTHWNYFPYYNSTMLIFIRLVPRELRNSSSIFFSLKTPCCHKLATL